MPEIVVEGPSRRPATAWVLIAGAFGFLLLVLAMPPTSGGKVDWPQPSWFWAFAVLPGLIGIANHVVTARQRDADLDEKKKKLNEDLITCGKHDEAQVRDALSAAVAEGKHRPTLLEAFAAAILITGVFSVVANARLTRDGTFDGLVFAGYGAYISTLGFLLVRLNANALSPRFLLNGALKSSIGMLIGYLASAAGLFKSVQGALSLPTLYFLIGLFHPLALKGLKKMAMVTFGVPPTAGRDLQLTLLEGVDDGAVDVLEEIGITSVQHLATMPAPEACGRSLYPRDRVLDWIDQAILIMHTSGHLAELRALGVHSAYALVRLAQHVRAVAHDDDGRLMAREAHVRWEDVARRLGLTVGGLYLLAECIESDPVYILLEKAYPERHPPEKHRPAKLALTDPSRAKLPIRNEESRASVDNASP